jgi:hypothetical protein
MYRSSVTNDNQHPTPPVLLKPTRYGSLATLPSQEVYGVDRTGRSSNIEENQPIMRHESLIKNKEDEFSTIYNPSVNEHNKFSSEFSTIHDIRNGDNEFSSEFYTRQNKQNLSMLNGSSEFSSGFSTVQTQRGTEEINLLNNELADAKIIQQSLLTSNGSLNKTLSSKETEIKYVLNIQNLTSYLTGESPNDYSEFINDNLVNFVNENAYCRGYDLSVNLECLKQKLQQRIRYLSSQKALKLSDTVNQVSYPVAETRCVCLIINKSLILLYRSTLLYLSPSVDQSFTISRATLCLKGHYYMFRPTLVIIRC